MERSSHVTESRLVAMSSKADIATGLFDFVIGAVVYDRHKEMRVRCHCFVASSGGADADGEGSDGGRFGRALPHPRTFLASRSRERPIGSDEERLRVAGEKRELASHERHDLDAVDEVDVVRLHQPLSFIKNLD
jgi:hypothetical protein